jgi:hypothetical protein
MAEAGLLVRVLFTVIAPPLKKKSKNCFPGQRQLKLSGLPDASWPGYQIRARLYLRAEKDTLRNPVGKMRINRVL